MTRAVTLANLADTNIFTVDGANDRVGIGTTQPNEKLQVVGVVSATSFFGDGSNLEGVASAGLGTALSDVDTEANSVIYFTNTTLGIGSTVVVDPPSTSNVAYTQYQEVSLNEDVDLIVADGDDFVPDILGLEEGAMLFGANSGGGSSSSGISAVVEDTTPQLGGNLDLNSKTINGNGNININGTFTGDGSGLTNVSAVGTGIGVSNSGTNVGTAQTINFGTGITISTVSAGLATVTVGSASTADVSTSTLNVTGVTTVGVMTASSLVVTTGIATFAGESSTTQGIHLDIGSEKFKIFGGSNEVNMRNTDGSGGGGSINIQGRSGASLWQGTGNLAVAADSNGAGILYYQSSARVSATSTGVNLAGIASASTHVSSGIVTYYGDSSYSAAGRWVLNASGTDHYTFTGPGLGHSTINDPTLYLMRGQTYMFENKMGAHPFRIQSTVNGSTGTQWNVGVTNNDVSNGVLIFEVPFVCPNTLYYQCTAHANMGGVLNIVT
mgnify:CR=1 FL=1|jgi:hypothetical protein